MHKSVLFLILSLLFLVCTEYTNPLDPKSPNYEPPSFSIVPTTSTIANEGTLLVDTVQVVLKGNNKQNYFRWNLDDGAWSDWTHAGPNGFVITTSVTTEGMHTLHMQTCYETIDRITTDTLSFLRAFVPTIIDQSQSQHIAEGSTCILWVQANGTATLSYKWFRGVPGNVMEISNETNDSLIIPSFTAAKAGSYYALVSNSYQSAATLPIELTAVAAVKDTTKPTIIVTPADSAVSTQSTVLITVLAADNSGIATVTIAGQPVSAVNETYRALVTLTGPQTQVAITATDNAVPANTRSLVRTYLYNPQAIDIAPPTIVFVSPGHDTTIAAPATIMVKGLAQDVASGIKSVTVNNISASFDSTTGSWEAPVSIVNEGQTPITVVATDNSNLSQSASITITYAKAIDSIAPLINIINPGQDTTLTDTATLNIQVSAQDDASGIQSVFIDGRLARLNSVTSLWEVTLPIVSEGTKMVYIVATDKAGKTASDSIRIAYSKRIIPPQWNRKTLTLTLAEGQQTTVALQDSCTNNTPDVPLTFSLKKAHALSTLNNAQWTMSARRRSAGTYTDTLVAQAGPGRDTLLVTTVITEQYYSLTTTTAANGSVSPLVSDTSIRYGDTLLITTKANTGYEFSGWSGDISGLDAASAQLKVHMDRVRTLSATFAPLPECTTIAGGSDLNAVMQQAFGSQTGILCFTPGASYTSGTNKVDIGGTVKFFTQ